jgi:hypothetical protein
VLYGAAGAGLSATGSQIWHQSSPGVLDTAEPEDHFGYALAAGDFDNDGFDDLVIGVPYENVGSDAGAGAANVLYGAAGPGLTADGDQLWNQNFPGVLDATEPGDFFGWALAVGDFDNDELDDLAIGVPLEGLGAAAEAGAVNVLYSATGVGLSATGNQLWHQSMSESTPEPSPGEGAPPVLAAGTGASTASALFEVYPNPFAARTTIGFELAEHGPVQVAVYDLLGREVAVLFEGNVEGGRHEAVLDGSALPAGVYLVRMTAGGTAHTQRVTLAR